MDVAGSLGVLTVRADGSHEVSIIEPEINISVVPPDPALDIIFLQLSGEVKASQKNSEVVAVDRSMGELVNVPENFKDAEIFETHEPLLEFFNAFNALDDLFTDADDGEFDVVV